MTALTSRMILVVTCGVALAASMTTAPIATAQEVPSQQVQTLQTSTGMAPKRKWTLGVYGNYSLNQHSADFADLPGTTGGLINAIFSPRTSTSPTDPNVTNTFGPPNFKGVNSSSVAFGALLELRASSELSVLLRVGYAKQDASFKTSYTQQGGRANGTAVDLTSEYTLDTKLSSFEITPMLGYKVVDELSVYAGLRIGLTSGTFSQKETLVAPSDGTFENGTRERNVISGDLPNFTSLQLAGVVGLGYDLNIADRLVLTPEAYYSLGLTQVIKDLTWKVNTIRAGVALKYRL